MPKDRTTSSARLGLVVPIVVALIGAAAAIWNREQKVRGLEAEARRRDERVKELEALARVREIPASPSGAFEWQWAGANWLGTVKINGDIARVEVKEFVKGKFEFRPTPVLTSSRDGAVHLQKDGFKLEMPIKIHTFENGKERPTETLETLVAELSPKEAYAGKVRYVRSDGTESAGDMVLVRYESKQYLH